MLGLETKCPNLAKVPIQLYTAPVEHDVHHLEVVPLLLLPVPEQQVVSPLGPGAAVLQPRSSGGLLLLTQLQPLVLGDKKTSINYPDYNVDTTLSSP